MKRFFLMSFLILGAACNGTASDGEESSATWDDSWIVGPVFEGFYGWSLDEIESVTYFLLNEDGSVDWGATFSCTPSEPMAFGTWTQTAEGEIEIHSSAESWPGNPGLDFIRMRRTDECGVIEAYEVQTNGSLTGKGGHYYSRGTACLSECGGVGEREIIACEGEPDPCS